MPNETKRTQSGADAGKWIMFMRWADLAFLHWPVPVETIRPLVAAALTIDTFEGVAWVGVVPFRMERTRAGLAPPVRTASTFPEINVRTYVRGGGRSGVWFFSLDAASRLAVWGGAGGAEPAVPSRNDEDDGAPTAPHALT
jgi:uncharacterized protein